MKLMTKAIARAMPARYSTEKQDKKRVIVKYFTPWSNWTWYAVEGEKLDDGDWHLFGFVEGFEKEWGYFLLSELESVSGPFGLKIERDIHFEGFIDNAGNITRE